VKAQLDMNSKRVKRGLGIGQLPEAAEGLVLDFVGRGEWFFVGQVSRLWRHRYLKHFSKRRNNNSSSSSNINASKSRRSTSYKAVLASVPRLQLAISNRFDVGRKTTVSYVYSSLLVASAAGKYADKEVLLWLKAHYPALWGESVCGGAIEAGRLEVLQWLHEEQQCAWNDYSGSMAAQTNNLPMLKYIYHKRDGGAPLKNSSREDRASLSQAAVDSNNLRILNWCRKKRLLVDGYERGEPIMYIESILTDSTSVQPWLFKHGYRLPADHDEYDDMMERHCNDPDSSSESDSDVSSDSASSSAGDDSSSNSNSNSSDDSDDNEYDSAVQDDDEEAGASDNEPFLE
jgi:hypothetical protein